MSDYTSYRLVHSPTCFLTVPRLPIYEDPGAILQWESLSVYNHLVKIMLLELDVRVVKLRVGDAYYDHTSRCIIREVNPFT